jgi:bifunctional non-homologous end joining protein LigD
MSSPELTGRFVIQRHAARTLHFDFRLERDGVFKSWAIPKGIPQKIGVRHLAIEVDDHPLEFGEFEGEIAKGEYGAGTIEIWDKGQYEVLEWIDDRIAFTLHGTRVRGTYNLIRFRHKGPHEWLIFLRRATAQSESRP